MSNLKEVSKNTIFQIIAKASTVSISLLITVLVTRQFSVFDYGEFIKIMSFVSVFYLLADFGFNATFLKRTSDKDFQSHFDKFFALRIGSSVFLTIFCILLVLPLPYSPADGTGYSSGVKFGVFLASFTIFFQGLFNTANAIFQKKLRYDLSSLASIIASLATLVLVLLVLPFNNLYLLILSYTFSSAVLFLVAYRLLNKFAYKPKPSFDSIYSKKMFLGSMSLGITLVINLIYFRIDTIILGFYRPPAEVAFYGLAYRIFETVLVIPIFFSNSIFPIFLANIHNPVSLKRIFKKSALLLTVISVSLSLFFFMASGAIINLISGPEFASSAPLLRILSIGYPLFFLSAIVMWLLISFNHQKLLSFLYLAIGALNLIANLYFIPIHGAIASAYITVISEFAILVGGSIILIVKLKK